MDIPNAYIFNVCSINSGKGYTYLTSDTAEKDIRPASPSLNNTLFVKKDADSQPVQILGEKGIVDYTLNGGELFIIGSLTNEPCGIWRYNVKSGYLDRIYSSLPSSKYAKFITPQFYSITNVQGKVVNYHLWPPANMLSHKKYPLMIGQTSYRWLAEAQVAANSGCYFAIADRPTFGSDKIDNWSEDVMSVYLDLEKNATVNIHHVYLFGTSIEGSYLSALMQEKSELWKGAFLEGATGPLLAQDRNLEMAIVVGNHDVRLDSVQKYVTRAAWNGVPIKAVLRNGSHKAIATSTPKANCRALAEFLLRNK
jgi:dipeptidyl aminopeptidase/acylaminoacyl peptidase